MSDWPPDRDQDDAENDIDMGEPVTDDLMLLLDEPQDETNGAAAETDMAEPVTGKLHLLFDEPTDEAFLAGVRRSIARRRLGSGASKWSPRGLAVATLEFTKALVARLRRAP